MIPLEAEEGHEEARAAANSLPVPGALAWQAMPAGRRFVIVFVVDGLRPDAITADATPTLHRLRSQGVDFTNSHAVFPTVTRVNAAALATSMHPGSNGIL